MTSEQRDVRLRDAVRHAVSDALYAGVSARSIVKRLLSEAVRVQEVLEPGDDHEAQRRR